MIAVEECSFPDGSDGGNRPQAVAKRSGFVLSVRRVYISGTPGPEAPLSESFDLSALIHEYRDEARRQLDRLDEVLLALERGVALSDDDRRALLRDLHTLKGNSGMLGYAGIRDSVHELETAFKEPPAEWTQEILDPLFEGAATLRFAVERVGTKEEEAALRRLDSALFHTGADATGTGTPPEEGIDPLRAEERGAEPLRTEIEGATEMLRVPFSKVDGLLNQVGEMIGIGASLGSLLRDHRDALKSLGLFRPLREQAEMLEQSLREMRTSAMELRLVPVRRVFSRFPRLVREIAREQGKQVRVVLEGGDTELDKSTVDVLGEPLLHLVRNAVDHGLELPAERESRGKPPVGTLVLRASQTGDRMRVEVEDDGSGLDRAAILAEARAKGLVGDEELTPEEIDELIFAPGFSTRTSATTVSGRGIGMDVVRKSVAELRGSLMVESLPDGGGTRFTISMPLTLALMPALLFESGDELYALPALDIEETLRRPVRSWVGAAEVIRHRDEVIPLARPQTLFGWEGTDPPPPPPFAIVVRRGSRSSAIAAHRLIDQRDVVVKALPPMLHGLPGVSGITVTPGERVVLLLDVEQLLQMNLTHHRRMLRAG